MESDGLALWEFYIIVQIIIMFIDFLFFSLANTYMPKVICMLKTIESLKLTVHFRCNGYDNVIRVRY